MRRFFPVLVSLPLMLSLVGCAQSGDVPGLGDTPDEQSAAFEQRATVVVAAWQAAPGQETWRTGYVPLQHATVLTADPKFTDETRQAFQAGWYRHQVELPTVRPVDGSISFPDGTLTVPLVSAVEAYQQIAQGEPPPCPGRPSEPPVQPSPTLGPDAPVSTSAVSACLPLTVTAVELGTVPVHTSRGTAQVPAWLFTTEELAAPVARLAVAPSAVGPAPSPSVVPPEQGTGFAWAQNLAVIDGAKLTYRLGVGACDTDITPLVAERDDAIVVAGRVTTSTGVCTDQLVIHPVTVTLAAPLGARPVLDAATGAPLVLTPDPVR